MSSASTRLYLAPLQGATDFSYRNSFAQVFGGVDKYFIPYISFGKGSEIKKSQLREVFPENNSVPKVIPQVLFSDENELIRLVAILNDYGHSEINLNLGCPYPMATNRGRGAAWLAKPDQLKTALEQLFSTFPALNFSVKMRAGMSSGEEAQDVFAVLNQFELTEIIYHPRTASQMYSGIANPDWFSEALSGVKAPLVYNGDISSETGFQELQKRWPNQTNWMIGRGILSDPSLPLKLKGEPMEPKEFRRKCREFHDLMFESYSARLDGAGHVLMKMNQFWEYFSESFDNPHKAMKLVKKAGSLSKYNAAVATIFSTYLSGND